MRTLVLNSGNIVPNTNNSVLEYLFVGGNVSLVRGQKVALATIQMYYSTFNITAANRNNRFSYVWVDGTGAVPVEYAVIFPDGFYDAAAINNFLHFTMVQNGHYLINDATGDFIYFITFSANANRYAVEVNCFGMSQVVYDPTLFTEGVGAAPAWTIPTTPAGELIIPMLRIEANAFRQVVGFEAGYYPLGEPTYAVDVITAGVPPAFSQASGSTSTQTFLSTTVPQITPLSSYILNCSLVNNNYSVPNSVIYSFSPKGAFGAQFSIDPNEYIFIDVLPAQYNRFQVYFTDQNNQPVAIQDPNLIIQLLITDPEDDNSPQKMLKDMREMFSDLGQLRTRG